MDWFVDPSVSAQALNRFFENMARDHYELHTLQVYQGDRQLLRLAQAPYTCRDAREIYSLSKMFCSTVVGIAVDQGYLTVEDSVADIFGKTDVSPRFSRMKVRHVLSMNTGHSRCVAEDMAVADSAVDAFFSVEPDYEPGTHFTYNTGATTLLCAIIEQVTGRDFFAYACENLFWPMDMTDISWSRCKDGTCAGGVGLHVCSDDIIKLGRMYAAGGLWNGKRILSAAWIREASSFVSDNSCNGTPDWRSGYGYQLWINARDGYRGDGAFGQLCLILPQHGFVAAVQAVGDDMQTEMDHIFELMDHLLEPSEEAGRRFAFLPPAAPEKLPVLDRVYRMDANRADLQLLRLRSDGDRVEITFADKSEVQTLRAERNAWVDSELRGTNLVPSLFENDFSSFRECSRVSASCLMKDGKLILYLRYRTNPHTEYMELSLAEDSLTIHYEQTQGWYLRPDWMQTYTGTPVRPGKGEAL